MTPECPICRESDADHIPIHATRPMGKPWYCRGCGFVYDGSQGERASAMTRRQRDNHLQMVASQERLRAEAEPQPKRRRRSAPNQGET